MTEVLARDFCVMSGLRALGVAVAPGGWSCCCLSCLPLLRRRQKNTPAMMPMSTTTPPTTPPAIAPTLVFLTIDVGVAVGRSADVVGMALLLIVVLAFAVNFLGSNVRRSGVAQPAAGAVLVAPPSVLGEVSLVLSDDGRDEFVLAANTRSNQIRDAILSNIVHRCMPPVWPPCVRMVQVLLP